MNFLNRGRFCLTMFKLANMLIKLKGYLMQISKIAFSFDNILENIRVKYTLSGVHFKFLSVGGSYSGFSHGHEGP